jgi:hypothetical protein
MDWRGGVSVPAEPAWVPHMPAREALPDLVEIEGLRGKIERRREGRSRSRPIPEELWKEVRLRSSNSGLAAWPRAVGRL